MSSYGRRKRRRDEMESDERSHRRSSDEPASKRHRSSHHSSRHHSSRRRSGSSRHSSDSNRDDRDRHSRGDSRRHRTIESRSHQSKRSHRPEHIQSHNHSINHSHSQSQSQSRAHNITHPSTPPPPPIAKQPLIFSPPLPPPPITVLSNTDTTTTTTTIAATAQPQPSQQSHTHTQLPTRQTKANNGFLPNTVLFQGLHPQWTVKEATTLVRDYFSKFGEMMAVVVRSKPENPTAIMGDGRVSFKSQHSVSQLFAADSGANQHFITFESNTATLKMRRSNEKPKPKQNPKPKPKPNTNVKRNVSTSNVETDGNRITQRMLQIDIGKQTTQYALYRRLVPKTKRLRSDPQTPKATGKMPNKVWKKRISLWRRELHTFVQNSERVAALELQCSGNNNNNSNSVGVATIGSSSEETCELPTITTVDNSNNLLSEIDAVLDFDSEDELA